MKYAWLILALCLTARAAQDESLQGVVLPVQLNSGLNTSKNKPGRQIRATVMQDVPGTAIRNGSHLVGRVLSASPAAGGSPAQIQLVFDAVEVRGMRLPIKTELRALASALEVEQAQIPQSGPDRGTERNAWTTVQIGGDEVVYRGGGPVARGDETVGVPTYDGVLGRLRAASGKSCAGASDQVQALWLFATDACGVYGLDDVKIAHAGRTSPRGEIILASQKGNFKIASGSGLLLQIVGN